MKYGIFPKVESNPFRPPNSSCGIKSRRSEHAGINRSQASVRAVQQGLQKRQCKMMWILVIFLSVAAAQQQYDAPPPQVPAYQPPSQVLTPIVTNQPAVYSEATTPAPVYEAPTTTYSPPLQPTYETPAPPAVVYEAPSTTTYTPPPSSPTYETPVSPSVLYETPVTTTYSPPPPPPTYETPAPVPVAYEPLSTTIYSPSPPPPVYETPAPPPVVSETPSTTTPPPPPAYKTPAPPPVVYETPSTTTYSPPPPPPAYETPAPPPVVYETPVTTTYSPPPAYEAPARPQPSYNVPATSGPYGGSQSSPSSYNIPETAAGPYGGSSSGSSSSYNVPSTPPGSYGSSSASSSSAAAAGYQPSTQYIPGQLVTTNNHVTFYAPIFKDVYSPAPSTYSAPAPAPGYGVPSPASSYGVPATSGGYAPTSSYSVPATSGQYGGSSSSSAVASGYAPAPVVQKQKIGDAHVSSWLTQTVLQGGGKISETKVKDGYNGYKTQVVEEWQDHVPNYNFGYEIKGKGGYESTAFDSSAQESRNGGKTTGRYTVKQPDGKTRIVEYIVDEWGFKPTITFV